MKILYAFASFYLVSCVVGNVLTSDGTAESGIDLEENKKNFMDRFKDRFKDKRMCQPLKNGPCENRLPCCKQDGLKCVNKQCTNDKCLKQSKCPKKNTCFKTEQGDSCVADASQCLVKTMKRFDDTSIKKYKAAFDKAKLKLNEEVSKNGGKFNKNMIESLAGSMCKSYAEAKSFEEKSKVAYKGLQTCIGNSASNVPLLKVGLEDKSWIFGFHGKISAGYVLEGKTKKIFCYATACNESDVKHTGLGFKVGADFTLLVRSMETNYKEYPMPSSGGLAESFTRSNGKGRMGIEVVQGSAIKKAEKKNMFKESNKMKGNLCQTFMMSSIPTPAPSPMPSPSPSMLPSPKPSPMPTMLPSSMPTVTPFLRKGVYKITTTYHYNSNMASGYALAGVYKWDGGRRNSKSSWIAVHKNKKLGAEWEIYDGKKPGTYRIKSLAIKASKQPAGWGLTAVRGAYKSSRSKQSTRVSSNAAVNEFMDWQIVEGKKKGTFKIMTTSFSVGGRTQAADWGLSAWGSKVYDGPRDGDSSWVWVHSGDTWPMDWKLDFVRKSNEDV